MTQNKLLPCPFCNNEAELFQIGNDSTRTRKVVIKCSQCKLSLTNSALRFDMKWLVDTTIQDWNKRAKSPEHETLLAFVKEIPYLYHDNQLRHDCWNLLKNIGEEE